MKRTWKREMYIIIHAQSTKFRIIKYIIIIAFLYLLFDWKGWMVVISGLVTMFVLGILLHFLFRWKTKSWTKSWGLFKKIKTPYDKK